jgi:hypothetical protein
MPKVKGDLVNLINGVSQQAAALRVPTQVEIQENKYSTIVDWLRKRPPSHVVAKLPKLPNGAYFHIIDRDENEKYVLVMTNDAVRVFDFAGHEKTVNAPDGLDYLSTGTPESHLRALTVADYTFIANRTVTCAMDAEDIAPVRPKEALVNIMAGNTQDLPDQHRRCGPPEYVTPVGDNANQSPSGDHGDRQGAV